MFEDFVLAWLSASPASSPLPCKTDNSGLTSFESPVSSREHLHSITSQQTLRNVNQYILPCCLIPVSQNFATVDAIVCSDDSFFTIQATVSSTHSAKPVGFNTIREAVPTTFLRARKWYHVFITNDESKAESLRNQQRDDLPDDITICSAVFDIDQLGSIRQRLAEWNETRVYEEKIIHYIGDEEVIVHSDIHASFPPRLRPYM